MNIPTTVEEARKLLAEKRPPGRPSKELHLALEAARVLMRPVRERESSIRKAEQTLATATKHLLKAQENYNNAKADLDKVSNHVQASSI